jgi:hypothetical protein
MEAGSLRFSGPHELHRWSAGNRDPLSRQATIPERVRYGVFQIRILTDKFDAVGVIVVIKVGPNVPVFHPSIYDGEFAVIGHLNPLDRQDVGV